MAVWRFHLVIREITGQDDNGWPMSRFVSLTVDIEENSVFKLRDEPRHLIYAQIKKPAAIVGVERIDKKTGNDYDWFNDCPEELFFILNEKQQSTIKELKKEIWSRALGGDNLLPQGDTLLIDPFDSVKYLAEQVACFYDFSSGRHSIETRILPHDQAEKHLAALQRFYFNITPVELQILCMNDRALSQEELEIIRSYNTPVRN
jgi:hypothetical protein